MADPPKRRLFELLRRTPRAGGGDRAKVADEHALLGAYDRAKTGARTAAEGAQRIATSLTRQRGVADASLERARAVAARSEELRAVLGRAADTFDRLAMVALNAGLEGARLGEGAGRALSLVGDEVRGHAARGGDAARDVDAAIGEIVADLTKLAADVDQVRAFASELATEAVKTGGALAETERAIGELGDRLHRTTGNDPEITRTIAAATEHARALVTSLGALSGKVPRTVLLAALRPVLDPLGRMLAEDEHDHDVETDAEES